MISGDMSVELGFGIAVVTAILGGLRRIDTRFNTLEAQVKEALKGRLTRQEHRIWALELQVRNPTLNFPDPIGDADSGE